MPLDRDTLTAAELEEFLKSELPGFASRLVVEDRDHMLLIQVRGSVHFKGEVRFDRFDVLLRSARTLGYGPTEAVAEHAMALVRETRNHAIKQLGLDQEIRRQVEEKVAHQVAAAKRHWEQDGYEKGMAAAITAFARAGLKLSDEEGHE